LQQRYVTHGGLTPAALDAALVFRRTWFGPPCKRDRLPYHGGLTPAALAERAIVHRECRYFSVDRRRALGAAGVSQPWGTIRSCPVDVITPRKRIAIAGVVTVPRRAEGRRSCKRAFVCRTSRSFAGKCPHRRTTKSGERQPPWIRYRDCTGVRHRTVDRLPRLCGSVLASAFP
jgi:hypothetical protein